MQINKHLWLQINDGADFRVLISPLPTIKLEEKVEEKVVKKVEVEKAESQKVVAQKQTVKRKIEKKIVKVEMKGIDNRLV